MVQGCLPMLTFTTLGYKFPAFITPLQTPILSYDRSTSSPMRVLQRVRASFPSFHSLDLIVCLRSSCSCYVFFLIFSSLLYFLPEHISEDSSYVRFLAFTVPEIEQLSLHKPNITQPTATCHIFFHPTIILRCDYAYSELQLQSVVKYSIKNE
jgi:hypothetical protein